MSRQLDAPSMELDCDDSFLRHEATLVNEVSSSSSNPSPVHSELADVQKTHLPTQQDSMNRPKCDTMTNASLMAPATQRINCGGSATPQTTHDAFSPSGCLRLVSGPGLVFNSHLPEQSYSCQCLQTRGFACSNPCFATGHTSSGDASGFKEHILATRPSLESLKRKIDLLQITIWILESDFLRLQLLEPVVGDGPMSYPSIIDDYGLKGQSIYTAFFDHLDMETYVCWRCGHTVEEDLEVAVAHQRAVHFRHEPYGCHALNGKCKHRFASQSLLNDHQVSAGH